MSSTIKADIQGLADASSQLETIESRLKSAERTIPLGGAAGHPELEEAMHDFARKWDIKREQLAENAGDLSKALAEASKTYADCETQIVKATKGQE